LGPMNTMTDEYDFDIAVIGSGPGGYVCAIRAAQLGARAAVIEKAAPGGICLNLGCIPTKTLIRSAEVHNIVKNSSEFGIQADLKGFDYAQVAQRKDKVVKTLTSGVLMLLKSNGVEYIKGSATITGRHAIGVEGDGARKDISASRIVVATGAHPIGLPFAKFNGATVIDSADAVNLTELPEKLIIVGGGYIGCEFAFLMSSFGTQVTVVEMMDGVLPNSDDDCSKEVLKALKKQKINVLLGTTLQKLDAVEDGVTAELSGGKKLQADKALVCVGRRPNSAGIGLESAGVDLDEKGNIIVDEHMMTSCPNIYAIGDVTGKIQLAHVASAQAIVAAEHATGHIDASMDYRVVPAIVFTAPEVASVGLSESDARELLGDNARVGKYQFRGLGKALASGETTGWVKVVADAETDEIMGVHVVGAHASEMIGEGALALQLEATLPEVARTIHAHPTFPEAFMEAAEAAMGISIHLPPAMQKKSS